jgi:hypothetical protein
MSPIVRRQYWRMAYLEDKLGSKPGPAQWEYPKPCRDAHYGSIVGNVQCKTVRRFLESVRELREHHPWASLKLVISETSVMPKLTKS